MDKEKVYYLAGAYSHERQEIMDDRFEKLTEITALLVKEGYVVFSPISYGHLLTEFEDMPVEFEFWKKFCLSLLGKCDEMIILESKGLDESKGVAAEIVYCVENNIPYEKMSEEEIMKRFGITEPEKEEEEGVVLGVAGCNGCPFLQMIKPTNESPMIMNCSLNTVLRVNGVDVEDKNIDPSSNLEEKPTWCPIDKFGTIKIR